MAQLGRCSCGRPLIKANIHSKSSDMSVEIDVCPVCDVEKMNPLNKSKAIEKSIDLDRFGLEKLQK
jgi:hypothetical protein